MCKNWFMVQCLLETALKKTSILRILYHFHLTLIFQGTTRNMASPALAGLVTEFFYTGPSALAALFPEVFAWEMPKSVVCLIVTVVSDRFLSTQCSLDILQLRATIDEFVVTGT